MPIQKQEWWHQKAKTFVNYFLLLQSLRKIVYTYRSSSNEINTTIPRKNWISRIFFLLTEDSLQVPEAVTYPVELQSPRENSFQLQHSLLDKISSNSGNLCIMKSLKDQSTAASPTTVPKRNPTKSVAVDPHFILWQYVWRLYEYMSLMIILPQSPPRLMLVREKSTPASTAGTGRFINSFFNFC